MFSEPNDNPIPLLLLSLACIMLLPVYFSNVFHENISMICHTVLCWPDMTLLVKKMKNNIPGIFLPVDMYIRNSKYIRNVPSVYDPWLQLFQ